ncbi:RNA-binding protein 1-like isoform X1 [Populus nigra]|uniref:RNA-binding protein 1-like isoform X1 n=1 Tax=Populus nigra TaxID=3691 RepID=UPI002B26B5E1|nr:RNA-binding protein 1-like isoform X1 [Populus nigra]
MADSYWRYAGDSRQPPPQSMSSLTGKRPRIDYDIPSGRDLSSYYSRDDDRGALHVIRDSDSIGASYDRYLRSGTVSSYGGGQSARAMSGVPSHPVDDTRMVSMGPMDPGASVKDRSLRMGSGRSEVSLPPDASSTLFVEGLPSDCTRREVSHIFRPFVGYKEVRLVSKESRHPGGDPLVLCFVDFLSPAHAATAMDALQGELNMLYIFSPLGSFSLMYQFPGPLYLLLSNVSFSMLVFNFLYNCTNAFCTSF